MDLQNIFHYADIETKQTALRPLWAPENHKKHITTQEQLYNWQHAELVTEIAKSQKSDESIPESLMNYQSLRAIGAGIQNTLNLQEWLVFLKTHFQALGVEFLSFTFVCKSLKEHYKWFRQERGGPIPQEVHNPTGLLKGDRPVLKMQLPSKILYRGVLMNSDFSSEYQNVSNGIRTTAPNSIENYSSSHHFFGASEVFGSHLKDTETIPSQYSDCKKSENVRVLNYGMGGVNLIDVIQRMITSKVNAGDKIFMALPFMASEICDQVIVMEKDDFFDNSHVSIDGARKVASRLHAHINGNIVKNNYRTDTADYQKASIYLDMYRNVLLRVESTEYQSKDISDYCEYLHNNQFQEPTDYTPSFGSVAVNCNPITNGHLSLIEYASTKVDFLYVLVIEEDKSNVKFKDRFEMVKLVCSDIPNTKVLKGGKFVCTEYIAPEYFVKDQITDERTDFTLESFYFGKYIAPELGITKIFLGDEPICKVTKKYNEHMAKSMPAYGIDLTIIPRTPDLYGEPISASKVRLLIKQRDWGEVRKLTPIRAFEYMLKNQIL